MKTLPRLLLPGLAAAALLALLSPVMDGGRRAGLPLAAVNAAALAYFAILAGAPLVLYPIAFFRGARLGGRLAVAALPFLAWWLSEVAFRARAHTLPEAVFLTLSVPNLLHVQLLALEVVIAELACRAWQRVRGRRSRALSRGAVLAAAGVLVWIASDAVLALPYYLAFQRAYRALFDDGPPPPPALPGPLPAGAPVRAPPAGELPNLVVILSDDHRADFAGHAGHPFVQTPSLDRLAAEGVRFRNAFVTSSLCSPSRASFLTGLRAARHGVHNNFTPWDDDNRTFFEYLKRAGYRTAFVGKWHMPGRLPELRGVDLFVTFTAAGGQGVYHDCPLVVNGREEPSRRTYIAEELTDRALAFVEASAGGPFALYLSHKNVHAPFAPDPREAGRYAEEPVTPPGASHSFVGMTDGQYAHLALAPLETLVRRQAEAVTSMDREIGRLLDRLDALGLAGRTLVVYTSDNGYLWGEHGLIDKRWAYEASIRIPLLLRYPGVAPPGTTVDRMAINLDLAPTLLDAAGLDVPPHMQGRSLLPLLRDPATPWRDAFYYAYAFEPPFPVPALEAVRTERHKYVVPEGLGPELYDLVRDPREQRNLAGEEAGLAARLRERLGALRERARGGGRTDPRLDRSGSGRDPGSHRAE